jgi:hypothetical protein
MPFPLIAAASAGASALKNLNTPGAPVGATGARQALNFQQVMAGMQQAGISLKDLMALSGPSLQAKIRSLTPQQQQALAQQLSGASLTLQTPTGASSTGTVNGVQLGGGTPTLNVAGLSYTLDKIQSINQAQV